jgi:hypothetical protein
MAFLLKDPVRCTFIMDSKCSKQVMNFNTLNANLNPIFHLLALLGAHHVLHINRIKVKCLGCEIFCENEKDSQQKLSRVCSNAGNFKQHFQTKFRQELFKVYNALAVPILPSGNEIWTVIKKG